MNFLEDQGHLSIHLSDPHSANALKREHLQSLNKNLRRRSWNFISCWADGRVFCSGGPLHDLARFKSKQQGIAYHQGMAQELEKFSRYPAWKVAFVTGDCIGGGIEFLSCFDEIYCEPHVLFAFWQNRLELSYGWGGFERLKKRVSSDFLKTALLQQHVVTAHEMHQRGLVQEILSVPDMKSREQKWKNDLESRSRKEIVKGLDKNEIKLFAKLWWSTEHRQRLQNILKKL